MQRPGNAMIVSVLALILIGMALMPPFFTHGACDAEFERVAADLTLHRQLLATPELAAAYFWRTANLPVRILSAQQCRRSPPRFVDACGTGDLLTIQVPVRNPVCRFYRDSDIRIQLQYDESGHLRRLNSDMKPYKYLHLPALGIDWNWGK